MTDTEAITSILRDARRYRALRDLVSVERDYLNRMEFAIPQHLLAPAVFAPVVDMAAELDRALDKLESTHG